MQSSTSPTSPRKRNAALTSMGSTDPQRMTPEQLNLRQLLIETADLAFRQRGIKKVTMDEVSKNFACRSARSISFSVTRKSW